LIKLKFKNRNGGEKMKKRGVFGINSLGTIAVILVVASIIVAFGGTILKDIRDDQTSGEVDYNVSSKGLEAMTTLGD